MSQRNGDKSRFHRERKQNIQRRKRTRELLLAAEIGTGRAVVGKQPGTVPAGKEQAHE